MKKHLGYADENLSGVTFESLEVTAAGDQMKWRGENCWKQFVDTQLNKI